jgi:hypothetical protein
MLSMPSFTGEEMQGTLAEIFYPLSARKMETVQISVSK